MITNISVSPLRRQATIRRRWIKVRSRTKLSKDVKGRPRVPKKKVPKDFILPALALAIPVAAGNIRVFRSSLLEGYSQDFVLYARSRGVSERRIAFMVSRFALPPLVTMLAQSFGFMIAGSAMVESVFSIPGIGSMLVTALNARDTITINACVLLTAAIFVLVNFIADLVNIALNPHGKAKEKVYDS